MVLIMFIDLVIFSYLPQVLPPKGFNIILCMFLLFGYMASQTFVPIINVSWALAFFLYAGIGLISFPFFMVLMK